MTGRGCACQSTSTGPPELTALAASIDIPAVLRASGYLEIGSGSDPADPGVEISEIRGGLDMTLVPIKLRIKAEIAIANIETTEGRNATGVVVSIEVTFPAPIPLGSSGLGLLGVLGLFAMHYGRNEQPFADEATPALRWLEATGGNPTRLSPDPGSALDDFWTPQIDNWAFGVGAVLGTAEGGVIFNLKGVFLLELPGPRILLMMKAAILTPPPAVEGLEEAGGSLLAVIDLDAGRGTLTIGIIAEYGVDPLVKIRIPVEAFFELQKSKNWHIYLGTIEDPIYAKVILVFEGSGYLMISGNGLTSDKLDTEIKNRFAIAVGMHVELIWGSREVRIYASVAGGFDALMGFQPFFLRGKLTFRGELRLIIIGISAYAELDVTIGTDPETNQEISHLSGEICGEVDLFFFKIKGCVDFAMGTLPGPPIPPLVDKMTAVSRSPALVRGTATDTPIDAVLSTAIMQDAPPSASQFVEPSLATADDDRPHMIPIDAVLALSLTASPRQNDIEVLDEPFDLAAPGSSDHGYTDRTDQRIFYELTGIRMIDGTLTEGNRPATWWAADPATNDTTLVQLALLTWVPSPFGAAIERSEFLEQIITDRWGTVCNDAAPAAPVLWAFHRQPLGPSTNGWVLQGSAWPDPHDTSRSEDVDITADVYEAWRSGLAVDALRGIVPAPIVGRTIACAQKPDRPGRPGGLTGNISIVPDRSQPVSPVGVTDVIARPNRDTRLAEIDMLAARRSATDDPADDTLLLARRMDLFTGPSGRMTDLALAEAEPQEAFRRLRIGEAVGRTAFSAFAAAIPPDPAAPGCPSRILAAPELDEGDPVSIMGDPGQAGAIEAAWDEADFTPSTLDNAVRINSGGIADARLLLSARDIMAERKALIVRVLDADDNELQRIAVSLNHAVPPSALPERWLDPSGPWCEDVDHALRFDGVFTHPQARQKIFLVELPKETDAAVIEIGMDMRRLRDDDDDDGPAIDDILTAALGGQSRPANALPDLLIAGATGGTATAAATTTYGQQLHRLYYVLCFELTRWAEAEREDYDTQLIESDRTAVGRYLGAESGDVALLQPNRLYGIQVAWNQHAEGETNDPEEATFWFHTSNEPPKRLGPYMLFTLPNERETHVFGAEPLTLVFSTPQVINLFETHGLNLEIRLRAASFRTPDPDDMPEGETYPFPLTGDTTCDTGPMVLTPFEETLVELLEGQCIPIDETRKRHPCWTLNIPLDPLTDYILDIVGVPQDDGVMSPGDAALHSVSFSTGAYGTLDRFAQVLTAQRINHRWVEAGGMQMIASDFGTRQPEGAELDAALLGAGLEAMPIAEAPKTTVFWEQADPDSPPQPVAILIDAPAPMCRTWNLPTKVVDNSVTPPESIGGRNRRLGLT
uniref:Uncharacterized protein n=1 Tax=Yoonia rhodophyticola TaxID=3137370 RepID=A0AAN0MJK1_9RHOB